MKTRISTLLLLLASVYLSAQNNNIGIGTTSPDASSILDVSSTTKGFLFPRMTYTQRTMIGSPVPGLLVYQTNSGGSPIQPSGIYFYDGSFWKRIARADEIGSGGSSGWTVAGDNQYSNLTGNAGIGTSTPNSKFHLVGNMLQENGTITLNHSGSIIQMQNAGVNKAYLQLSGNNLRLGTNSGNTGGEFIIRMNSLTRMVIDSLGNVGIGTASPDPSAKLDISSTTKGLLLPRLTSAQMYAVDNPTEGLMIYNTDYELLSHYNGSSWKTINNSTFWIRGITTRDRIGNSTDSIGIGTPGPLAKLHVTGGTFANYTTQNGHIMVGSSSGLNMAIGHYEILARNDGAAAPLYLQQEGGLVRMGSGTTAVNAKLQVTDGEEASLSGDGYVVLGETSLDNIVMDNDEIQARNNGLASTLELQPAGGAFRVGGGNYKLYINSSGNVGIGNSSPNAKLDVSGRVRVVQNGEAIAIDGTDPNIGFWRNGAFHSWIGQYSNEMYIASNDKLHIDADQIAIGAVQSTANNYKLTVTGKIICEELKVELTANWPDYVFGEDYQLKPLHELKSYIATNKHLPNIPKASEVEKDGLEVGEMNRKLLEKVEELTLYIIDLQEQVDQLKLAIGDR